ncbi:MAG: undecaprenyl/decaprenyl-phosphate alpha-N-acetylglucosaminyl 1-phosphate transferase [Candidatus Omnitrophica bacterium]|nr:undecaprenyl/decaprenyl-phosphate alpha-N-acetylglucosaminyl 1-phosphate transferase [Candidatus Omnitrophota bacterium]
MTQTPPVFFLASAVFCLAIFLSHALSGLFIRLAHRFNLLDYPTSRKRHKRPTPFLGGAAVFLSFWSVVGGGLVAAQVWGASPFSLIPRVLGIFLGSLVIFGVGLVDDKIGLTPLQKLLGQIVAALILVGFGFSINLVSGLGPFGYLVTFVWILLIINAFNFIDSLDGHCAGIALISAGTLFWITQIVGQPLTGFFIAAFVGALAGFLPRNFRPAKIFLGDNGSLFVGYMLAAFTLLCRYQREGFVDATVFIPVLIFGIPIYDTLSVIAVRLRRGVVPWEGDRNHFAHRLVKMGMSDRVAVIFSYFIAVTLGLSAILTTQVTFFGAALIGLMFLSILGVIAFLEYYAAKRERIIERLAKTKRRRREDIVRFEEEGLR